MFGWAKYRFCSSYHFHDEFTSSKPHIGGLFFVQPSQQQPFAQQQVFKYLPDGLGHPDFGIDGTNFGSTFSSSISIQIIQYLI